MPVLRQLPPNYYEYITSRWEVDGYEWETRFYPCRCRGGYYDMSLELVLLSDPHENEVVANVSCRLVDPTGILQPSAERISDTKSFQRSSDSSETFQIMRRTDAHKSGHLRDDGSVTLECTVTVFKDPEEIPLPSSDLTNDLSELLRCEAGSDVTFLVSGESFAAHKNVLAARSPVFMAEFSGEMKEKASTFVEIKEIEPAVFKAMLHFIYTDTAPELNEKETGTAMAQHLFMAADRYGLDRLRLICERRIALGIDTNTVTTALALAEQHGCAQLKAKCAEFINGRSTLDADFDIEGFKSLEASSPSVVTVLLKAAYKWIKQWI